MEDSIPLLRINIYPNGMEGNIFLPFSQNKDANLPFLSSFLYHCILFPSSPLSNHRYLSSFP